MSEDKEELAEQRTEWAEDRTLLANERTYGGWMRTSLAGLGIALGFHAIFQMAERAWLAKIGATIFIAIAIAIVVLAHRNAYTIIDRMQRHEIASLRARNMRVISAMLVAGSIMLGVLLWMI